MFKTKIIINNICIIYTIVLEMLVDVYVNVCEYVYWHSIIFINIFEYQ